MNILALSSEKSRPMSIYILHVLEIGIMYNQKIFYNKTTNSATFFPIQSKSFKTPFPSKQLK